MKGSFLGVGCVAAADGIFDTTVAYVTERKAFGGVLSNFQNTRYKLADMKTEIELNRALAEKYIERFENGELTAAEASLCKLAASEMQGRIADQCLQLFGGYGYMREYKISRFLPGCENTTNLWRHLRDHEGVDRAKCGRSLDCIRNPARSLSQTVTRQQCFFQNLPVDARDNFRFTYSIQQYEANTLIRRLLVYLLPYWSEKRQHPVRVAGQPADVLL